MSDVAEVFDPIDTDTVAEAVVAQIEELIVTGVLRSGQKLPAERELAALMDVSRPKLRDGLKALEGEGLLTVRHGDGAFVAQLNGAALSGPMIALFSRHPRAFFDYLEYRREMEGFAAHLAAQRATEHDRALLGRIVAEMEDAHAAADRDREAALDVALHSAVMDAAHNAMLGAMMASLYELMRRGFRDMRDGLWRRDDGRETLLRQHRAIAEAVQAGDPDAAAAAAEAHLDYVRDAYRSGAAEQGRARVARKRRALYDLAQREGARRRRTAG